VASFTLTLSLGPCIFFSYRVLWRWKPEKTRSWRRLRSFTARLLNSQLSDGDVNPSTNTLLTSSLPRLRKHLRPHATAVTHHERDERCKPDDAHAD
jgi:hypothetical protein